MEVRTNIYAIPVENKIRIYNNSGVRRSIKYNYKMCYLNDAKLWNGLDHITTISLLPYGGYVDVTISWNWFADAYAFSYADSDTRVIAYAYYYQVDNYTTEWRFFGHTLANYKEYYNIE